MGHGHHHHPDAGAGGRRLGWAVAINLGLTVVQIGGGILSGSLALVADAVHNLSDALSLIIAWAARRIARRPADAGMTFGYRRAEVVAALINYTTLVVIALYLLWQAALRVIAPAEVLGPLMIGVAVVALVVDLGTVALTRAMARDSVNIRAALLHNLGDAAGSLGVILAGGLIWAFGWTWVDPAVTALIAAGILWMAITGMKPAIRILMLGAPAALDADEVLAALRHLGGVDGVHRLRLWEMQEGRPALDTHLVIAPGRWAEADAIKASARDLLAARFGIHDTTLEVECAAHVCAKPEALGPGPARA